ncbi:hypothetical protein [Streptomyces ardesiacus]|uniref:hypothetical protein n=1 Tax=Streptomyces ardesiacus TaxID=285564 RepID=UPI003659F209
MKTRIFTRDELDAFGVPFECDPENGYAEELYDELYDTTRWTNVYEFVFRAPDDGKAYRVYYEVGASDSQDDTDPWNWDDEITAVEVEQIQVTKTEWKPVKG